MAWYSKGANWISGHNSMGYLAGGLGVGGIGAALSDQGPGMDLALLAGGGALGYGLHFGAGYLAKRGISPTGFKGAPMSSRKGAYYSSGLLYSSSNPAHRGYTPGKFSNVRPFAGPFM